MNDESETKLAERALAALIQLRLRAGTATSEEAMIIAREVQPKSGAVYSGEAAANNTRTDAWLAISKVGMTIKEKPGSQDITALFNTAIDLTKVWMRVLN